MMKLELKNLTKSYEKGKIALDHFSAALEPGVYGLLGPNGAGKSTLMNLITQNLEPDEGEILVNGISATKMGASYRDVLGYMPQQQGLYDRFSALEFLRYFASLKGLKAKESRKRIEELLEVVNLTKARNRKLGGFSGGMKQRVIIAIALACNPQLLIADEPTTALDVTIQAQVLEMIRDLKQKNNTSMLLITHDLGVVAQNCDSVAIIYAGEIVEYGTLCQVYENAMHPYTEGLFGSIPNLETNSRRLAAIDGMMPDPTALPEGCKFADRCKYATEHCRVSSPELAELEDGHKVRCFRYTTRKR